MEPSSYQAIGWITVAIFALVGGINQVIRLVDRAKGSPPVEQLKMAGDAITHRVEKLEGSHMDGLDRRRKMHEKIESTEKRIQDETRKELNQVYGEINKLRESVAGLHRDTENQNRHLVHIESKLDRLIERGT